MKWSCITFLAILKHLWTKGRKHSAGEIISSSLGLKKFSWNNNKDGGGAKAEKERKAERKAKVDSMDTAVCSCLKWSFDGPNWAFWYIASKNKVLMVACLVEKWLICATDSTCTVSIHSAEWFFLFFAQSSVLVIGHYVSYSSSPPAQRYILNGTSKCRRMVDR